MKNILIVHTIPRQNLYEQNEKKPSRQWGKFICPDCPISEGFVFSVNFSPVVGDLHCLAHNKSQTKKRTLYFSSDFWFKVCVFLSRIISP